MASGKAYLEFILDQLSLIDCVSYRAMMGEYIIYCREKIVGGIYDDRFLVKKTPTAVSRMPDTDSVSPYDGAKEMLVVNVIDDRTALKELIEDMLPELPAPKPKKAKNGFDGAKS